MQIIFISMDRALFTDGSPVRTRLGALAAAYPQHTFTFIVFSLRSHQLHAETRLAPNAVAYSTNSCSRLLYGLDAIRIARTLPPAEVVSSMDAFETGLAALRIARRSGAACVVEVHTDFTSPAYAHHSFLNRLRIFTARYVLRHADAGYAVSEHIRNVLAARYTIPNVFAVLPIYVDLTAFATLPRTPVRGNVLWVGRFAPEKNPRAALSAVQHAIQHGHDVHMTMLGEGEERSHVIGQVKAAGLEDRITCPGWGDPADYLPRAELLLVTSEYEGYGMVMVEALAAGVPVLAPDVGIAREAGAVIVTDRYEEALAEWLSGPRERGTLTHLPYADEAEYRAKTIAFYELASGQRSRATL